MVHCEAWARTSGDAVNASVAAASVVQAADHRQDDRDKDMAPPVQGATSGAP
jgi:hypothetical protein